MRPQIFMDETGSITGCSMGYLFNIKSGIDVPDLHKEGDFTPIELDKPMRFSA
jgi:hypothetical protein